MAISLGMAALWNVATLRLPSGRHSGTFDVASEPRPSVSFAWGTMPIAALPEGCGPGRSGCDGDAISAVADAGSEAGIATLSEISAYEQPACRTDVPISGPAIDFGSWQPGHHPGASLVVIQMTQYRSAGIAVRSFVPFLLFGLIVGVYADRCGPRRICWSPTWSGSFARQRGTGGVLHALTLVKCNGGLLRRHSRVLFEGSHYSLLPALVTPARAVEANRQPEVTEAFSACGPGARRAC